MTPTVLSRRLSRSQPAGPILFPYLLVVAAYALLFSFWQVTPVPQTVHLLAILLFATCLLPLARWYTNGAGHVPIFELIVLSYALQFSMPVYTQPNVIIIFSQPVPLSWADIESVLLLTQLGVMVLIASYALAQRLPFVRGVPRLELPLADPDKKRFYIVGAVLVGGAISLLQGLGWLRGGAVGAILWLLSRQMQVAIVLLAYDLFRDKTSHFRPLLLYVALGINFVTGLLTGMLENAFIPLMLVVLVYWHAQRRIPWRWLLLGGLLFLILNPAKLMYRSTVWYGSAPTTVTQRVELWGDLAAASAGSLLERSDDGQSDSTFYDSLARFDLLHRFAYVHRLTPTYIPYYQGQTYEYFVYGWVPRLLWPGKPRVNANQRIDIDYRLKHPSSHSTIGIGQLPEAYINFGLAGIVLVMALQGLIFALLDNSLNRGRSEGGRAIYLSVMVYFLNGIGSAAAVLFGALFQQILVNALIMRPFASGWRVAEQAEPASASE